MPKNNKTLKNYKELLTETNNKLDILILLSAIQGNSKNIKIKILKNYNGSISKRELERITGIDRHEF